MSAQIIVMSVVAYALTVGLTFPIGAFLDPDRHREMPWRWRLGIAFFTWPGIAIGLLPFISLWP